jgi:hypothetical protein
MSCQLLQKNINMLTNYDILVLHYGVIFNGEVNGMQTKVLRASLAHTPKGSEVQNNSPFAVLG